MSTRVIGALLGVPVIFGGVIAALKLWELDGVSPLLLLITCLAFLTSSVIAPILGSALWSSRSRDLRKSNWG